MPKVSIILPVYNVEHYIRQALDSIVNQTLSDIEIICVNDCTPDSSFEIVKEYASKDSRFVLLEQEKNQGQGVARNRALETATGDYIMFLDSDDWLELNACELAYNQISKNNNEIVFFNYNIQNEKNGKVISKQVAKKLKNFDSIKNKAHIDLSKLEGNWMSAMYVWTQIYKRDFLIKNNIKFSEDRFTEDALFSINAIISSQDISMLDMPLCNSRRKKDHRSINHYNFYNDIYTAKQRVRELIKNSPKKDCFWVKYLIYETWSNLKHLKSFCRNNKKARKELYPKIRERFIENNKEIPENILKESNFYRDFKAVLASKTYFSFRIRRIILKFFNK